METHDNEAGPMQHGGRLKLGTNKLRGFVLSAD